MNMKLITLAALTFASPALAATFTLTDQGAAKFSVAGPASLPSGYTTFTLKNSSKQPYTPVVARLKNGATDATFKAALNTLMQSHGEDMAAIDAVAEFVGGSGGVLPGGTFEYGANLASGKYVLFGFGATENGQGYYDLGQFWTFTVTGAKSAAVQPKADVKVALKDFKVDLPTTVKAGRRVWEVTNAGKETHHLMLMRLKPGKALKDVEAFFQNPQTAGEPPFEDAGGLETLSPGRTAFVNFDLAAGEYLMACFLPSAKEHAPHFALGMLTTISVK